MPLVVQKFGGTSVADTEKILAAARTAIRAQQAGNQVVMVVSAMGKNTDMLEDLASQISDHPPAREMDMLLSTGEQVSVALMAMAIDSLGHRAVSLTGGQIGIKTDSVHTKARIRSISTTRMQDLLDEGNIVIAAGFQGIDENFNITTLGRGGSDTTAVALTAVLHADTCEIYTDVDGVYTTDPRVMPEARRLGRVSYDEMLELASLGAGVMHSRSIEFAKKFDVPIHVRSSFTDIEGSMIVGAAETQSLPVSGAALTKNEARVTINKVPDIPGASWEIFSRIANRKVTVDMIVQNVGSEGLANISFTVPRDELELTLNATREAAEVLGDVEITSDDHVSKVSVVGSGMARQIGVADRMFRALADAGINIQMITTSEIKISALVKRDQAFSALRTVHEAFSLHEELVPSSSSQTADRRSVKRTPFKPAEVVQRLRQTNMEELTLNDITLDATQSRLTICGIPDTPGVAAHVFEQVAAADIFVDMIVQGFGQDGQASLSFTVPRDKLQQALEVTRRLADEYSCQDVTDSPSIAKLCVSGIGLRSHTVVAIRTFQALAAAKINVVMVNTSEVRVNVVVEGNHGKRGLAAIRTELANLL